MWQWIKNVYHLGNAVLANVWFGFPSKNFTVVGVTGTDGKTTTVSLIYHILHNAGYNASMISSVGAIIGGNEYDVGFHVTTPSSFAIQRFLTKAALCHPEFISGSPARKQITLQSNKMLKQVQHDNEKNFLVLETTSHALDQYRVFGIKFDVGVLTNVTHEHLDYHKTYENYVKTKSRLLKMARVAVVNRDDNSYPLIKSEIRNPKFETNSKFKILKLITYGIGTNAEINTETFPFKSKLIGEFNKYNVLAAVAACKAVGIEDEGIRKGIASFTAPIGREEIVYKKDFTIMIDFAHTPNAFEQILSSIKSSIKGRLIHVFGAAGERDASKRPMMGKVSCQYADVIVLTAEDPRSESVEKIIGEIESGIMNYELRIKNGTLLEIYDRKEAIETAIKIAKKGDFVLITGKSHEKSMNYGHGEEPWDEFGAVREALENLSGRSPRRSPFDHLRGGKATTLTPRR